MASELYLMEVGDGRYSILLCDDRSITRMPALTPAETLIAFSELDYPDIGALELQAIKAGDINQLLRNQQAMNVSLSIPVKVYTIVRAIIKMAYKDELIDRNPMDKVDRPHKRKDTSQTQAPMACTADELQKLCEALKTEPFLWQALVRLLVDSGMRVGECVGLLWSNVDFDRERITVDGTMVYTPDKGVFRDLTKNGKSRTFGVDPEVMEMLRVLRDRQRLSKESEYVFTNESTGLPLHPDSPRRFLKKLGEKCGIEGLHPHLLRHSFASVAITNGADIASVLSLRISGVFRYKDKSGIKKSSRIANAMRERLCVFFSRRHHPLRGTAHRGGWR